MVQETENWSREWNSSTKPEKQRKYRRNAPMHVNDKLVSVNLNDLLRTELDTRNLPVRVGDRAKIMRGDEKGLEGIVSKVDREEQKIYLNKRDRQRTDGTVKQKPFRPSNLQLQALNLEDPDRIEKYDVDDLEEIQVEEEELEELEEDEEDDEMMQQMQQKAEARQEAQKQQEEQETEQQEETQESEETSSEESSSDSNTSSETEQETEDEGDKQ